MDDDEIVPLPEPPNATTTKRTTLTTTEKDDDFDDFDEGKKNNNNTAGTRCCLVDADGKRKISTRVYATKAEKLADGVRSCKKRAWTD